MNLRSEICFDFHQNSISNESSSISEEKHFASRNLGLDDDEVDDDGTGDLLKFLRVFILTFKSMSPYSVPMNVDIRYTIGNLVFELPSELSTKH